MKTGKKIIWEFNDNSITPSNLLSFNDLFSINGYDKTYILYTLNKPISSSNNYDNLLEEAQEELHKIVDVISNVSAISWAEHDSGFFEPNNLDKYNQLFKIVPSSDGTGFSLYSHNDLVWEALVLEDIMNKANSFLEVMKAVLQN